MNCDGYSANAEMRFVSASNSPRKPPPRSSLKFVCNGAAGFVRFFAEAQTSLNCPGASVTAGKRHCPARPRHPSATSPRGSRRSCRRSAIRSNPSNRRPRRAIVAGVRRHELGDAHERRAARSDRACNSTTRRQSIRRGREIANAVSRRRTRRSRRPRVAAEIQNGIARAIAVTRFVAAAPFTRRSAASTFVTASLKVTSTSATSARRSRPGGCSCGDHGRIGIGKRRESWH